MQAKRYYRHIAGGKDVALVIKIASNMALVPYCLQRILLAAKMRIYLAFSGRSVRTVSAVRHNSLSCRAFSSSFNFSR